jgi:hypothetical protein
MGRARGRGDLLSPELDRYKPAVTKRVLLLASGLMWVAVGCMLVSLAVGWWAGEPAAPVAWLAGGGVLAALLVHHLGLLRVVDKNLDRILPAEGPRCFFSFMSWRSYLMVGAMMGLGAALRASPLPRPYLAALYLAMGLALLLSSVRYLRHFVRSLL